jgi:RimJ/RimL family protein N-acetyltransferase
MHEQSLLSELRDEYKIPLFELINDRETVAFNSQYSPVDWASHCKWFNSVGQDKSKRVFAIAPPPGRTFAGVLDIKNIHPIRHSAEISINLTANARDKGIGRRALSEAVEFCWKELNLNRIYMHAMSSNKRAIQAYIAVGFEIEGTLRSHSYFNGQYHDFEIMGLLRPNNQ